MFGSKISRWIFLGIGLVVLLSVLGVVVRIAGRGKLEVRRTGIVSGKAVMPPAPSVVSGSGVEASQNKGGAVLGDSSIPLRSTQNDGFVNASRQAGTGNDDVRRKLQRIYTSQIGIREATGKNDGPEVEEYLRYIGLGRGNAWCAAFVSWTFHQAGMDRPKTAWSPALFPDNRLIWQRNQQRSVMPSVVEASQKKSGHVSETHSVPLRSTSRQAGTGRGDVQVGDIFGLYFSELKRIAHCGFVDSWDGTWCITVEGNANDIGSFITVSNNENPIRAGPGEGVYRKKRLVKTIYKVADWVSK